MLTIFVVDIQHDVFRLLARLNKYERPSNGLEQVLGVLGDYGACYRFSHSGVAVVSDCCLTAGGPC